MSRSPLTTSGSRRSRGAVRRRRRRRAMAQLVAALALVVAAAVVVLARDRGGHPARLATQLAGLGAPTARPHAKATPARSPLGLRLGTPPLTLRLADTRDPVRMPFHQPPRSGLLFDLDSGRVLWRRDPERRLPIASLTKMMTGLIVAERSSRNATVPITPEALAYQGSGIGLLPLGKRVPLEALLYGLMLPSGNDAAIALAQDIAGSVPKFVRLMNVRAAQLGLGCTRFSSPHGFYDQDNYSCATDLAVLAHADLAQPWLAQVVGTRNAVMPFPIKGGRLFLFNNNPLMALGYPGITGLKTGYTLASGQCLVVTAQRHGVRLGVVLLHSPDPALQASRLLDRAFAAVYHQAPEPGPVIPPTPASAGHA